MRIGIFGGSFNPVHNGHLALAEQALTQLGLQKVIFVPSHQTPLKDNRRLLPDQFRTQLLKAALKRRSKYFAISSCEQRRKGPSFTVDTLRFFKKKYGKNSRLYFIAGMDVLKKISLWKSLDEIFSLCIFVIADRAGSAHKESRYPIVRMPLKRIDISSTEIRKRLTSGLSVRHLVPEETELLLKKYFDNKSKTINAGRKLKSKMPRK